jgi:uncharacterized SAM-binding protein YcdF (DUF218 family)
LKRIFFWTGFGLLFFFSNGFIANEVMRAWEPDATPYIDMKKRYEYGIVLTGVTSSELVPRDRVYFHKGADRVTHTVQLYKLGIIKKVIVSGGSGRLLDTSVREANDVMDAMIMMGVPTEDILVEDLSRNTFESAVEIRKLLDQRLIKPAECILITSAFHMRRSIACFRKADMDMNTFTTDFYTHRRTFTPDAWLVPRVEAMLVWQRLIKEWIGFVAYKIVGYV